jgi:hypothetical protein
MPFKLQPGVDKPAERFTGVGLWYDNGLYRRAKFSPSSITVEVHHDKGIIYHILGKSSDGKKLFYWVTESVANRAADRYGVKIKKAKKISPKKKAKKSTKASPKKAKRKSPKASPKKKAKKSTKASPKKGGKRKATCSSKYKACLAAQKSKQ